MKPVSVLIVVSTVLCWTLGGKTFAEVPEVDHEEEEDNQEVVEKDGNLDDE